MANKKTIGYSVVTILMAALSFLGGTTIDDSNAYYCESKALVAGCDKLSSTGGTCYWVNDDGANKRTFCSGGWAEIEGEIPVIIINSVSSAQAYLCNVNGSCVSK